MILNSPLGNSHSQFFSQSKASPNFAAKISGKLKPLAHRYIFITVIAILLLCLLPTLGPAAPQTELPPALKEALALHTDGQVKEAIDLYNQVIEKNPKIAEAYNWRGMAYEEIGDTDKALADFNQAIQIAGNYADAYNNRGEIQRKLSKLPLAVEDFKRAISYDKNFAEAHYNLALVYEQQKKPHEAIAEYREYLRLAPSAADQNEVSAKLDELTKVAATVPAPRPQPDATKSTKRAAGGTAPNMGPNAPFKMPGAMDFAKGAATPKFDLANSIFSILSYAFVGITLFMIANKTATPLPWLGFIPIANMYLMNSIARQSFNNFLLYFASIPGAVLAGLALALLGSWVIAGVILLISVIAGMYAWFRISFGMAAAMDADTIWGILLFIPCTTVIGLGYLAFFKK